MTGILYSGRHSANRRELFCRSKRYNACWPSSPAGLSISFFSCDYMARQLYLRNRRWGGSVYVLQMFFLCFFLFFCYFPSTKTMRQPFSGTAERIFMKLLPNDTGKHGIWNVVPPPGEWRMLICVIYADSAAGYGNQNQSQNSAMTLAQSPEGATHGGCVIKSWAREWI